MRSGPAAGIFPVVYHDLVRWIHERGYHAAAGPGREIWVNEVDDIADVAQQVFEIQLPFTRTAGTDRASRRAVAQAATATITAQHDAHDGVTGDARHGTAGA